MKKHKYIIVLFASLITLFSVAVNYNVSGADMSDKNISFTGKVNEKRRNRIREYNFEVLLSKDGYKIKIFNDKKIEISSAYSDYKDPITYNAPSPVVFGTADLPSLDEYIAQIVFSPTPYPFYADDMLQAVWLTTCANKTVMDEIITKYPPGVVFRWSIQDKALDWKGYSIGDVTYSDSQDQALLGFVLRRPENIGITLDKKSLIDAGISKEAIEKLETPSDGSQGVVLPLSNGIGGSLYCKFSTTSRFPDIPFSKETLITWYDIPRGGIQTTNDETKISVETIKYEDNNGKISPDMPYSSFSITDYRFKGMFDTPSVYHIPDAVLPFYNTKLYKELAQEPTGTLKPKNKVSNFTKKRIVILMVFIIIAPFIFMYSFKKKTM